MNNLVKERKLKWKDYTLPPINLHNIGGLASHSCENFSIIDGMLVCAECLARVQVQDDIYNEDYYS